MHIKRYEAINLRDALSRIREELGPEALVLESRKIEDGSGGVVVLAAAPETAVEREAKPQVPATRPKATPAASDAETRDKIEYLSKLVRSDHFSAIPLPLRDLYLELVDAEVDSNLVFHILQRMGSAPLPGQFVPAPPAELRAYLGGLVACGGWVDASSRRRVIALVGPTGVGKTTTVAKIAGQAAFSLKRRVALVSTDTYRIYGAEHLRSYAALMGLPFELATGAAEMRGLLKGPLASSDLVLIDTSGRSPRDPKGISEIHRLLAAWPELEVHLVLAANGRVRDLCLALDGFSALPIRHLIFTKLDEATTPGGIYSTALKARRPVAYLGTGQEVPEDLIQAGPEALTEGLVTRRD